MRNHSHEEVMKLTVDLHAGRQALTVFISKDAISVWADRLGLKVELIHDGDRGTFLCRSR